jgi:hypothetical protein
MGHLMKNDICLKCNINCIDVDDVWIQCPECNKKYVRSTVSDYEYSYVCPGASMVDCAYNPIWGASSLEQIKELTDEGYPSIVFARNI